MAQRAAITAASVGRTPSRTAQCDSSLIALENSVIDGVGQTASWSGVYLTAPSTNYPICTLTFGLAVTDYSRTWGASGQGIATSVHDYFNYINTALGGRADALTAAKDYQDVPSDVATAAATGIASITD